MTPLSLSLGWVAFAGITLLILAMLTVLRATPDARPEPVPSTGPGRCTETCTVPRCDGHVTTRIYASGEFWPMCLEHGLPYLTEGLAS